MSELQDDGEDPLTLQEPKDEARATALFYSRGNRGRGLAPSWSCQAGLVTAASRGC